MPEFAKHKRRYTIYLLYYQLDGKPFQTGLFDRMFRHEAGKSEPYMPDVVAYVRGERDTGGPGALPGLGSTHEGWDGYIVVTWQRRPENSVLLLPAGVKGRKLPKGGRVLDRRKR